MGQEYLVIIFYVEGNLITPEKWVEPDLGEILASEGHKWYLIPKKPDRILVILNDTVINDWEIGEDY